jgi:dTDP-4-amino-4,6-dideoxygalactose transaminase
MYYILLPPWIDREMVLSEMKSRGISAIFHYVPLHRSPAGLRYCRTSGELPVTDSVSERLIRLPLWMGISYEQQDRIVDTLANVIKGDLFRRCIVQRRG